MPRNPPKRSTQPTNTIPVVLILASIFVALIATVIIGTIALTVLNSGNSRRDTLPRQASAPTEALCP